MEDKYRKSGIDIIGDIPWGVHFYHFYQTQKDLIDILVPYFKAGLENNEFCMWVTSEPLDEKEAKKAIRKAVPDFGKYLKRGQIEILPYDSWYLKDGVLALPRALNNWVAKLNWAINSGYDGMRVSGNTAWLEKKDWRSFTDYEEEINRVIGGYRMMALCTYSLDACNASEIIDVVSNHRFALIRRNSKWVVIESTEQLRVEDDLKESMENYKELTESINDVFFAMNEELRYTYWNRASEKLTGIAAKDALGKHLRDIFLDLEESKLTEKDYLKAIKTKQSQNFVSEYRLGDKDFVFDISAYPTKNGISVFVKDITEIKRREKVLRESEERFRDLADLLPQTICETDIEGKITFVNRNAFNMFGYSPPDLDAGLTIWQMIAPADLNKARENIQRILMGEDSGGTEYTAQRKDGSTFPVLVYTSSFIREDKPTGLKMIVVDITERKQMEEALEESEEKFRKFFEDSPIGIAISGHDKRFLNVNSRFCDMLGYTPGEIIGATFADITHPDYVEKDKGNIEKISRGEMAVYRTDKRYIKKNKEPLWAFTTVSGVYNVENTIKYYLAMVDDITERKQAEEALKTSLEQYHDLYEEAPNAYFSVGADGCIKIANHRATELLGYSMDELIGKPVIDLYAATPAGKAKASDIFRQFTSAREVMGEELQMLTADGRELWITLSVKPIVDKSGQVVQSRSVVVDITEHVKMREQLIMQDRLASIGQLVSGIAHELNNPLTGVIGFSDMLLERDLPKDIKEDLETINNEAKRTANIVKGLLTFARKQKIEKESLDINSIIQGILQLRSYEQRVSNIEVNTRFAHDLPQIFGNGSQLQQVFLNIIINAEQAMLEAHERGRLTITTEQVGNMVRASFTDDGPGIAEENLGHLFEPFFTTKEVGKGTGLGLSISHGIISAHAGKIYAESQLGKGANFVVELPVSQ